MNIVDDRHRCRPAGTERWLRDGFLDAELMLPLSIVERQACYYVFREPAEICQNMFLATEALGLGGWKHCGPITSTLTTTTGSSVRAPTGRRTRRTWRLGTGDVDAAMIEVSSGGDQFPELRILVGHIGVPWLGEMLSLVMNDTSAYKVIRYPKDLVDYMRRSNRQKVLFGSNHPFWPASECLADFEKLGLSEKAAIFKLN